MRADLSVTGQILWILFALSYKLSMFVLFVFCLFVFVCFLWSWIGLPYVWQFHSLTEASPFLDMCTNKTQTFRSSVHLISTNAATSFRECECQIDGSTSLILQDIRLKESNEETCSPAVLLLTIWQVNTHATIMPVIVGQYSNGLWKDVAQERQFCLQPIPGMLHQNWFG